MSFDVVIVGAGVAGLSAAIRLKQLARDEGRALSVVVLEKGAEVGAHILSGAIVDPVGLDRLLPDWREKGAPLTTKVAGEAISLLSRKSRFSLPHALVPRVMRNKGCYVGSLGALTRWLGEQASGLGVEIYPGFAGAELLFNENSAVKGVATPDQGRNRDGEPTPAFTPGMELLGAYTLVAEGARGFLSEQLIKHFKLGEGRDVPKYALGVKELWQVPAALHRPGEVLHTIGWPLPRGATGGGFLYHYDETLISVGLVVHLDYGAPGLSPFDLFQIFKTHPSLKDLFKQGKRIGYGARTISEGGWQSVPKLTFPGGALVGCGAGMMNLPRLKGSHNAILSAILAAQSCYDAIADGRCNDEPASYQSAFDKSQVAAELMAARNIKPLLERYGSFVGGGLGFMELWSQQIFGRSIPATLSHPSSDRTALQSNTQPQEPRDIKPDDIVTFDRLSSLRLAGVFHSENQPVHLILKDQERQLDNMRRFGVEPAEYYCPANVYELRSNQRKELFLHISASNCLHCKACDIKDPAGNISWQVPASGGPNYVDM
jgi:electron-transferring-flavoprotein dehydrogenase